MSTPVIVDVHSHAFPTSWTAAVRRASGLDGPDLAIGGITLPEWSPAMHLAYMDRAGIATCVLSQPAGTAMLRGRAARDLARRVNEEYAEVVAADPQRFGAFAILPLDDIDAAIEEMAYALDELRLDGVACETNFDGVYLGDPYFEPWFEEMHRRKAVLFAHPAEPPAFERVDIGQNVSTLEFMFDSTRAVTNLVVSGSRLRHPDVQIISTHGGGTIPYLAGRIALSEPFFGAGKGRATLSGEEMMAGLRSFHFDLTATTSPGQLDALLRLVPVERLLLGFDFPLMPPPLTPLQLAGFDAYDGFTDSDRAKVRSANALRLLPRLAARRSGEVG